MLNGSHDIGDFFDLMRLYYHVDGEVPGAMHVWKDIPGGNRHYLEVIDCKVNDRRYVVFFSCVSFFCLCRLSVCVAATRTSLLFSVGNQLI